MRTVFILMAASLCLADSAFAQDKTEQACMIKAREAIIQSTAYKNASVRRKQQMLHALNSDVRAKLKACRVEAL